MSNVMGRADSRTFATHLARRWVRLYTAGAPEAARIRRGSELESDLWEHEHDRLAEGLAPSIVALEVLGRMVRGMPADLFWRLRLEGQPMQLNIPFERITGIALLLLVLLIPIAVGIDGYDTSREGWGDELSRLGELSDRSTRGNTIFHAIAGTGLVLAATAFYCALRERAAVLATFAAFGLGGAAILVFASSAAYQGLNTLANDYVAGRGGPGTLETSRALAIVMASLGAGAGILLALSVGALSLAAHRLRIVPRWMVLVPLGTLVIVPMSLLIAPVTGDEWTWLTVMGGLGLLLLWLIMAGVVLLVGRRTGGLPVTSAAAPTPS